MTEIIIKRGQAPQKYMFVSDYLNFRTGSVGRNFFFYFSNYFSHTCVLNTEVIKDKVVFQCTRSIGTKEQRAQRKTFTAFWLA
jgi:hypothetical protein